jgi:hypothetical protein
MSDLSQNEVALISKTVRTQGITYSHLPDDLIDHICCDIENLMQQGSSFTEAFATVRQQMGSPRRLREIQEETLYAVDTKYRNMKTTMKIAGITGTILFGFASLFKIMHWPLAGILMVLGALTLALIFMPAALGVLWKETRSPKRIFLFIATFLTTLLLIFGILFKVQHWPGTSIMITLAGAAAILLLMPAILYNTLIMKEHKAPPALYILTTIGVILCIAGFFSKILQWPLAGILLVSGLLILFLIAFPWYTIATMKNDAHVRPEFIFMVVGALALLLPASLISINHQYVYEQGYYVSLRSTEATTRYLSESNNIIVKSETDSLTAARLYQLHNLTGELIKTIETVETEMLSIAGGTNYRSLPDPFTRLPAMRILQSESPQYVKVKESSDMLKKYLSDNYPPEKANPFIAALDPSRYIARSPEGELSLLTALHSLSLMKNALLTAENILLNDIIDVI